MLFDRNLSGSIWHVINALNCVVPQEELGMHKFRKQSFLQQTPMQEPCVVASSHVRPCIGQSSSGSNGPNRQAVEARPGICHLEAAASF